MAPKLKAVILIVMTMTATALFVVAVSYPSVLPFDGRSCIRPDRVSASAKVVSEQAIVNWPNLRDEELLTYLSAAWRAVTPDGVDPEREMWADFAHGRRLMLLRKERGQEHLGYDPFELGEEAFRRWKVKEHNDYMNPLDTTLAWVQLRVRSLETGAGVDELVENGSSECS